ncbi:GGDEF domain-containing protein [Psychromonas sp. KJ10-10]|uniref:GGDEF domain-containing protein n=1 Tax=Psychromonas sp. KJ10-10 TaxID=3391823 RepID=UPI0039B5E33E
MDFNNQFIGLIGIGLTVNKVRNLIEKYQQKYNRTVYFTDKNGAITLAGSGYMGAKNLNQNKGLVDLSTQILKDDNVSFSYKVEDQTVYLDSRFVPEFKWYLIVEQSELEGQQDLMNTLWRNILFGFLTTLALMLLANRILSNYQHKIESIATTDTLTKASTRQAFDAYFEDIINRSDAPIALIILDIDDFKQVNDKYGHNTGDQIIKTISDILLTGRRENDLLCRWGGEEFILLLPNTSLDKATDIAERLRALIASHILNVNEVELTITASFGVAQKQLNETKAQLINRADLSLYQAKTSGKNRVSISDGS